MRIEPRPLSDFDDVWVYENFLTIQQQQHIGAYLEGLEGNLAFNFEGRKINFNNKDYTLMGVRSYRPYYKLWQLRELDGYWNQTPETIFGWAEYNYKKLIPLTFLTLAKKILTLAPLKDKPYIITRGIYNLLPPGQALDKHADGDAYCTKGTTMSATYYIKNEGEGGEFWDERGLFFKPKENSVLINIGSKWLHGVAPCTKKRLGITFRFVLPEDLILPGSIDKLLYKPQ